MMISGSGYYRMGIRRWSGTFLNTAEHEPEQALPTGETQVLGERGNMLEKRVTTWQRLAQQRTAFIKYLQHGMEEKCKRVQ